MGKKSELKKLIDELTSMSDEDLNALAEYIATGGKVKGIGKKYLSIYEFSVICEALTRKVKTAQVLNKARHHRIDYSIPKPNISQAAYNTFDDQLLNRFLEIDFRDYSKGKPFFLERYSKCTDKNLLEVYWAALIIHCTAYITPMPSAVDLTSHKCAKDVCLYLRNKVSENIYGDNTESDFIRL